MRDSLDSYDRLQPTTGCPNRQFTHLVNEATGELHRLGCYSLSCAGCLPNLARRYGGAIGLARPDYHIVLTQVGDNWQQIRSRVNLYRRNLRRARLELEDVYHVEPNPRGTGNHVHMWAWGDLVEEHQLRDAAARARLGTEVLLEARRLPLGQALCYGVKMALDQPRTPDNEVIGRARQFLDLNGGRLGHASRNFWRDERGERIGGVRQAMKRAHRFVGPSASFLVTTLPPVLQGEPDESPAAVASLALALRPERQKVAS